MAARNSRKSEPEPPGMDDIREILDLLDQRGISEFEMENNGFRLRIKREPVHTVPSRHVAQLPHLEHRHARPLEESSEQSDPVMPGLAPPPETPEESPEELHLIKSPIVGTFYGSPSPDAPSYVKVGDMVQEGQILCIIEAMKLMNEIEADVSGQIARIFVENGKPVEYGQSLFAIHPSAPI